MIDISTFSSSIQSIQSTLTTVIIGLITAGGTVAGKKINDHFSKKSRLGDIKRQDKDLEDSAKVAVDATEQLSKGKPMTNDEKKDRACKVCAANLKRKGWDGLDEILIDSAVENQLYIIHKDTADDVSISKQPVETDKTKEVNTDTSAVSDNKQPVETGDHKGVDLDASNSK